MHTSLNDDLAALGKTRLPEGLPGVDLVADHSEHATVHAQLVALGVDLGLGFVRTLALLLKFEVESQRAEQGAATASFGLLPSWPTGELIKALQPAFPGEPTLSPDRLPVLMAEMLLLELHRVPNDSADLAFYIAQKAATDAHISAAPPTARARFHALRSRWLRAHEAFAAALVLRETRALRRDAIRRAFMQLFGTEYLEMQTERARLALATLKQRRLADDPSLSSAELDAAIAREIEDAQRRLRRYLRDFGLASSVPAESQRDSSSDALTSARLYLRKLWMKIHPDRLRNVALTERQRQRLADLWEDAMAVELDADAMADDALVLRSREHLRRTLERAEVILEQAGIDIDPMLTIRGRTLDERIAWLDDAIATITHETEQVQIELANWAADPELREMTILLGSAENIQDDARVQMCVHRQRFRVEADALETAMAGALN